MIEEAKGKNIKFVAVFPTKVEESRKHLAELGITGFEVKQALISALDASGTPTLIVTNSKGEVENFWIGKLPADSVKLCFLQTYRQFLPKDAVKNVRAVVI